MREMSVRELRDSLPSIGEIVGRDGEVVVTRHGRPIAKVVPLSPGRKAPSHASLRAGMARVAVGSEVLVRADREGAADHAPGVATYFAGEPAPDVAAEPTARSVPDAPA
jgi:prevent-host-death family protein